MVVAGNIQGEGTQAFNALVEFYTLGDIFQYFRQRIAGAGGIYFKIPGFHQAIVEHFFGPTVIACLLNNIGADTDLRLLFKFE